MKNRMNDMLKQADEMSTTINDDAAHVRLDATARQHDSSHGRRNDASELIAVAKRHMVEYDELRDHIADFDDFWRPIRNYFYWEPHCYDIPICWSLRSIFDAMDGVDRISDKFMMS